MEIDPKDQKAWDDYVDSHYRPTRLGKWLVRGFGILFFLYVLTNVLLGK